MKYIRAKDNIWKYDEIDKIPVRPSRQGSIFIEMILGFKKEYIEKQADTIEELCDEFVVIFSDGTWETYKMFSVLEDCLKMDYYKGCKYYGAIWTEWGLKYVAKMNEKGELELL